MRRLKIILLNKNKHLMSPVIRLFEKHPKAIGNKRVAAQVSRSRCAHRSWDPPIEQVFRWLQSYTHAERHAAPILHVHTNRNTGIIRAPSGIGTLNTCTHGATRTGDDPLVCPRGYNRDMNYTEQPWRMRMQRLYRSPALTPARRGSPRDSSFPIWIIHCDR